MILATICKLLLALGVGYYLNKKDIFTAEVNQKLSSFVMNVCLPLVVLTSLNEAGGAMGKGLMTKYIIVGCLIYAAMPFIGKGLNALTKIPKDERPVYELSYIFPNTFLWDIRWRRLCSAAPVFFKSACLTWDLTFYIIPTA